MSNDNNNHKHRYVYVFTSTIINDIDIEAINAGYIESTKQGVSIGESCSFYECKYCREVLITRGFNE